MSDRPRIFISAVSRELHSARQLVANTLNFLGCEPVWQDIFGTEDGDLREMLRRKIDACHGLIQLTGQRFGFGPTNPETDPHAVSYTQFELLYARERGKQIWPVLLAESFPTDAPADEPAAHRENQKAYRQRLKRGGDLYQTAENARTIENLVLKLRQPLDELRAEWREAQRRTASDLAQLKAETAQIKKILAEYIRGRGAAAAVTDANDDGSQERALLAELEKKHALPAETLGQQLPVFGRQLAEDRTATTFERAQGTYATKDYAAAERLAIKAAAEARQAEADQRLQAIQALELAGLSASERRDDQKAFTHFSAAAALTDRTRDPLEWARIHHALAWTLHTRRRFADHESLQRQVLAVRSEKLGPEHRDTLQSRSSLAVALYTQAKYQEAETEHRALVEMLERAHGPEDRGALASRQNLAVVLAAQHRDAEAEAESRTVIKLCEHALGPEHPMTLTNRSNLANWLQSQKKYSEAEAERQAVWEIRQRILGPEHPDTLDSRHSLAVSLLARRKGAEAEKELRAVFAVKRKVLGFDHPATLDTRYHLAHALYLQRHFADAEAEYRGVLELRERLLGPEHPDTINTLFSLAKCLRLLDRVREGRSLAKRVLEVRRKVYGPAHPGTRDAEDLYEKLAAKHWSRWLSR